jgi:hypothetical protein
LPEALSGKRYYQYRAILPPGASLNDIALLGLAGTVPPVPDAVTALRIAGGLQAATSAQMAALDAAKGDSAGKIDLADVVTLLRSGQ